MSAFRRHHIVEISFQDVVPHPAGFIEFAGGGRIKGVNMSLFARQYATPPCSGRAQFETDTGMSRPHTTKEAQVYREAITLCKIGIDFRYFFYKRPTGSPANNI